MGLMRENPIQGTVRTAQLSVLIITTQFQYTIQHKTALIISPLTCRQPSYIQLRCLWRRRGIQTGN